MGILTRAWTDELAVSSTTAESVLAVCMGEDHATSDLSERLADTDMYTSDERNGVSKKGGHIGSGRSRQLVGDNRARYAARCTNEPKRTLIFNGC